MIIAANDGIVSVFNFRSERRVARIAGKPGDMRTKKTHAIDPKGIGIHELLSYSRLKHAEWFLPGDDLADKASKIRPF